MLLPQEPFVPLNFTNQGVVRVGKTRVTLETVVSAFLDGSSPEEIVQQYDALTLADVYAVVAYYLRHRPEVDAYLSECRQSSTAVKATHTGMTQQTGLRERLLSRQGKVDGAA